MNDYISFKDVLPLLTFIAGYVLSTTHRWYDKTVERKSIRILLKMELSQNIQIIKEGISAKNIKFLPIINSLSSTIYENSLNRLSLLNRDEIVIVFKAYENIHKCTQHYDLIAEFLGKEAATETEKKNRDRLIEMLMSNLEAALSSNQQAHNAMQMRH